MPTSSPVAKQSRIDISANTHGDSLVVRLEGELDLLDVDRLSSTLRRLVELGGGGVVVDARQLSFIDCAGARSLLEAHRRAHENGRGFVLVPSVAVDRVVTLLEWDDRLPRAETVEEAIIGVDNGSSGSRRTTPRTDLLLRP